MNQKETFKEFVQFSSYESKMQENSNKDVNLIPHSPEFQKDNLIISNQKAKANEYDILT